jgi:putative CocE/NonD family hydrolase
MGGWTIRDDWAFVGGAFQLSGNLGWAAQMGAEAARLAGDTAGFQALAATARAGVPASGIAARPEVMARFGHHTHYAEWLADQPTYWPQIAPAQRLAGVALDVPGLHIGGWLDFLLDGTLGAYAACAGGGAPQHLLVGPWAHSPWGRRVGALDLGADAIGAVDAATVAFLDHVLKGQGAPPPPVRLFDVGARSWRLFDAWPTPAPTRLHLASDGLAATRSSGRLVEAPDAGPADWLVHDPWRPVPVLGGPWGTPPGFQDRAALDDRTDVAVYQSAPFAQERLLAGRVAATLFVATEAPSYDLHVTLSLVEPDGRAYGLACGHLRVGNDGPGVPRRLALRALCCTVTPGQALRLSVQAAAWPAFAVNPGTGAVPEATPPEHHAIVTLALRHEAGAESVVEVPLV